MGKKNNVKHENRLTKKKDLQGWIFVSPLVIGIVFIFIWIIIDSIRFSFGKLNLGQTGFNISFVGIDNYYRALFVEPDYTRKILGQILFIDGQIPITINVPVLLIFSLFIAVLLNQKMPGRGLFRAMFFMPVILSVGLVEKAMSGNIMLNQIASGAPQLSQQADSFQFIGAALETYLRQLSFSPTIVDFVVGLVSQIADIINQSGVQILIFLAGLQSISPSIYESASIEGATAWESFWKITLPMIAPMVLVNAVYSVVDYFTRSANPIMTTIQQTAFTNTDYGLAAAMSWIYFLVIGIALILVFAVFYLLVFRKKRV